MIAKRFLCILTIILLLLVSVSISAQEEAPQAQKKVSVEVNLLGPLFFGLYEAAVEVQLLDRLALGITPLYYNSELVVLYRIIAGASARTLWYTGAKLGASFYPQAQGFLGAGFGAFLNTVYFQSKVPVWSSISSGVALGPGVVIGYRSVFNLFSVSLKSELQYLIPLGVPILEHAAVRADYPALAGLSLYLSVGIGLAF